MSALVSNLGATFVTETGIRSSSVVGVHLSETVATGGATVDLAGDLSPSIAFAADVSDIFALAGDLTVTVNFAADVADLFSLTGNLSVTVSFAADVADIFALVGGLSPSVAFAADLTVDLKPANYVDLSGNLGGASSYGRGKYGAGKYSQNGAITPLFAGDTLQIVGEDLLVGDLAPVVSFAGNVSLLPGLVGDLAPQVSFRRRFERYHRAGWRSSVANRLGRHADGRCKSGGGFACPDRSCGFQPLLWTAVGRD